MPVFSDEQITEIGKIVRDVLSKELPGALAKAQAQLAKAQAQNANEMISRAECCKMIKAAVAKSSMCGAETSPKTTLSFSLLDLWFPWRCYVKPFIQVK